MAYIPEVNRKEKSWQIIIYLGLGALVSAWYALRTLFYNNRHRFSGIPEKVKTAKNDLPRKLSNAQTGITKKVGEFRSELPQHIEESHSVFKNRVEESRIEFEKYMGILRSWFPTQEEEKEKEIIYSRSKEEDTEFMPDSTAAVLEEAPIKGRFILNAIVVFFIISLLWAAIADLDEITRGMGKAIPSQQVQIIQNLEGGIVKQIHVKEGEMVEPEQILVSLDDTRFSASLRENQLKYLALKAKAARLQAEAEGVEFEAPADVLDKQPGLVEKEVQLYTSRRKQHERNMELVEKELNMTRPLVEQGAISEVEVLRLERQVNELDGKFRNEARAELNDTNSEVKRLFESNLALEDRVTRTKVRSPVKGVVKQIMINTVGGVIKPGMDIIEVVPLEEALLVQARIRPSDIAFLHPGQDAIVKFTAYDYAIYGGLKGKLEHISADTITDENDESFYLVKVRTDKNFLGTEKEPLPIIPGMMANVDILTGKKSVLSYLLKPVLRAKEVALTER